MSRIFTLGELRHQPLNVLYALRRDAQIALAQALPGSAPAAVATANLAVLDAAISLKRLPSPRF